MALVIGAVLVVLSILVVVFPFLQSRWRDQDFDPAAEDNPEVWDLDSIYDSIRTLQLEHQLGNIPEGLYQEQLRAYRLQAAVILRNQALGEARDEDWTLEEEIRVARAGLHRQNGSATRCPNCGTPVPPEADQCSECNLSLDPHQSSSPEEASQ
ncbi:MAG: hypothetical protein ACE5Q6_12285 [Dehalococcoidia bacterium]